MADDTFVPKTPEQIDLMRRAGLIVADALAAVREAVKPGVSTAELDRIANDVITSAGARPSFLGYHGFPATLCTSVNHEVVHGIPSPQAILRSGDLISIDCGATLDGWHGDSAITVAVGEVMPQVARLAKVCEDAMWAGIAAARVGGRLTDISHAIEQAIRGIPKGRRRPEPGRSRYGLVRDYGGHGIGSDMHEDPFVPNHGKPGRGMPLVAGTVLAIEPMISLGSQATRELSDGWTVVTKDSSVAAHTEHTFALMDDGPWVLTAHDGGRERLGDLVSARAKVS